VKELRHSDFKNEKKPKRLGFFGLMVGVFKPVNDAVNDFKRHFSTLPTLHPHGSFCLKVWSAHLF